MNAILFLNHSHSHYHYHHRNPLLTARSERALFNKTTIPDPALAPCPAAAAAHPPLPVHSESLARSTLHTHIRHNSNCQFLCWGSGIGGGVGGMGWMVAWMDGKRPHRLQPPFLDHRQSLLNIHHLVLRRRWSRCERLHMVRWRGPGKHSRALRMPMHGHCSVGARICGREL